MHGHPHEHDSHDHDSYAHHSHDHHVVFDTEEMAAQAELEGEVMADVAREAMHLAADECAARGTDVRRVLDLGCGPGVGTCLLAEAFPSASVVAADGAGAMLSRVAGRADRLGVGDRVEVRPVELPDGLDDLGRADVAWASLVLHHLGDEAAAVRRIHDLLPPGGVFVLVERAGPWRVLPEGEDLGRPGIWDRLDAAWSAWFDGMRAELAGSTPTGPYADVLAAAGFDVVTDRVLTLEAGPPLGDAERRFARRQLERTAAQVAARAEAGSADEAEDASEVAADVAALRRLLDDDAPDGILRRPDAVLHGTRHLYLAVRPG